MALRERHRAQLARDPVAERRAWKLFGLVPIMLLHRPRHTGSVGRDELCHRADEFVRGRWADLLHDAQDHAIRPPRSAHGHDDKARRGAAAQSRVQRVQVSRGRHELTGAPLAPRNNVTLEDLRRQRPQEQRSAIPQEVTDFSPGNPLQFNRKIFADCLRSAPSAALPVREGARTSSCAFVWTTTKLWICFAQPPRISQGLSHLSMSCARSCWRT